MRSLRSRAICVTLGSILAISTAALDAGAAPIPIPTPSPLSSSAPPRSRVTPPAPSTINRKPVLTKPMQRRDTCQAVTREVRQQALARGSRRTLCTRPAPAAHAPIRPPTRTAPAQPLASSAAGPDALCQDGQTVFTRFSQCTEATTGAVAIDNNSGAIIGEVDFQYAFWTTLANNARSWTEEVYIIVTNESGAVAGNTSITAPVQCSDAASRSCIITSYAYQLQTQQALMDPVGTSWSGEASFSSPNSNIDFQLWA